MLEPEAAGGAGIVGGLLDDLRFAVVGGFGPVLGLLVLLLGLELVGVGFEVFADFESLLFDDRGFEVLGAVELGLVDLDFGGGQLDGGLGGAKLLLGHQLGQGARQRVDLVRGELGTVAQHRRFVDQEALEPEQQRVVAPPLDRGVLGAAGQLGERRVERLAAGRSGRQRLRSLAVEQEGLAGEDRRTLDIGARWDCRGRGNIRCLGHRRLLGLLPPPQESQRPKASERGPGKSVLPTPRSSQRSANREPNVSVL